MLTITIETIDAISEEERDIVPLDAINYMRVRHNGQTIALESRTTPWIPKLLKTVYELGKQDARAEDKGDE